MEIPNDFSELLALLNAHSVDYFFIGGYALAFHGTPRFTGDLDILVKPGEENAQRIINALDEFGFESVNLTAADFLIPDNVIELGYPLVRVVILTSISGVSIDEVFAGRIEGEFGKVRVFYIGLSHFIANKRATGRSQDIADLEALGIS